jgi:bacteriocin-like protein
MSTINIERELSQSNELRDDELNEVTGGLVVIPIIGIVVGLLLPAVNKE